MDLPLGMISCLDPDCPYDAGTCFGRPEDYSDAELSEPDACESCGDRTESMDWKEADKAWICCSCGYAHVRSGPFAKAQSVTPARRHGRHGDSTERT